MARDSMMAKPMSMQRRMEPAASGLREMPEVVPKRAMPWAKAGPKTPTPMAMAAAEAMLATVSRAATVMVASAAKAKAGTEAAVRKVRTKTRDFLIAAFSPRELPKRLLGVYVWRSGAGPA
jgi:hypothetical protein